MKKYTDGWFNEQVKNLPQNMQAMWDKWDWPPESFDQLLRDAENRTRIAAFLTGCKHEDTLIQNMIDIDAALREVYEGKIPEDTYTLRGMIKKGVEIYAKTYAEKRLCHDTLTHMVCYCNGK
ncbi:MAG: hypothetical protein COU47_02700 [Candidatus Niyogibacteria bacterium CG10_big_fil_rev_8_21_14_0_10_46_36]|uniref:Uncharacterized protein n=1 Tax=Candidatus Niyogibacteria bacterium CG10_big_fil_rev_8_21_14_0_10_46_36 TaxID=1974726 RepID=A0A2H0TD41_9BACT|nr:MAG: hypothetical protein COU47_02700 [Candidatus Niyogibacteria bacterium CG10_big_fil_rev_8_21_14_0_10_46_36]